MVEGIRNNPNERLRRLKAGRKDGFSKKNSVSE